VRECKVTNTSSLLFLGQKVTKLKGGLRGGGRRKPLRTSKKVEEEV